MSQPLPDAPRHLADGRYTLIEPIGAGGAAEVWTARDNELDVVRAIKLLTQRASQRPTLQRRLRAEARVLARIDHPHVLRIVDIGEHEGRAFLVMDHLAGGSLGDRVRLDGPLAPREAVTRILEVLSGLAAAHGQGIVHRDVKPANILLADDGRAVLADFGIALVEAGDRRTRTGVAMGSFAFMPPEQRIDAKRVGPTADLYAAGATLYFLVTGRSPVDLFAAAPTGERYAGVDRELARLIAWATAAEPADRPPDAATWAAALRDCTPEAGAGREVLDPAGFPPPSPTLSPDTRTPATEAPAESRAAALVIAALAVLAVIGLVATAIVGWQPPDSEPGPTSATVVPGPPAPASPPSPAAPVPTGLRAPQLQPGRPAASSSPHLPPGRRWAGSFDGRPVTLRLQGPAEDLRGTWTVRFDGNAVQSAVRGRWAEGGSRLILEDVEDVPDAGRYEARREGARLEGSFRGRYREVVVPFTLRAEGP